MNILTVSRIWPGITPFNVWDMPYDMWLMYVAAVKELKSESG